MLHTIDLPWPSPALSPNSRGHWRKRHAASKAARLEAYILAKKAGLTLPPGSEVGMHLDFFPPDSYRKRDDDNLVASFKPWRDGLASAMKVDDRSFLSSQKLHHNEPVKGGLVRVTFKCIT